MSNLKFLPPGGKNCPYVAFLTVNIDTQLMKHIEESTDLGQNKAIKKVQVMASGQGKAKASVKSKFCNGYQSKAEKCDQRLD